MEYHKVIMCDYCKKINPSWHHANNCNSSRFCDICGNYCSDYKLSDEGIRYYDELHRQYLKED